MELTSASPEIHRTPGQRGRVRLIVASAAVVAIAVVIGLVLASRSRTTQSGQPSQPSSSTIANSANSASPKPTGTSPIPPSITRQSRLPATTAISPPTLSSLPNTPATFDETTAAWWQTLCNGYLTINDARVPPGVSYPSVGAAKEAYVSSYRRRAALADATAGFLENLAPSGAVADGRIDTNVNITGLRRMATTLNGAASVIQNGTATTKAELDDLVMTADAGVIVDEAPDIEEFTADEQSFVGSLPGCATG